MAKAYAGTPIGINIAFNTRNGPFFGTLLFVSGYMISGSFANIKWLKYGFLICCFGIVLHFSELYVLWKYFETTPIQDYLVGTYFMGVGIAIASLSNHPVLQNSALSSIGQMALGIYAVHFIFVDIFNPIDKRLDSPFWEIGYVVFVLILSIITVTFLSRIKVVRKIVV